MPRLGFQYHPDLLNRFPEIHGGAIVLRELKNCSSPPGLINAYQIEQRRLIEAIGAKPLSEIPSLAAWRKAFRLFGVDPTKYRNAAEALLRRLTKKGDIPSISALVDLCNLVSIRFALPVAAFDAKMLSGPITVQFAVGTEIFTAHDSPEPEHPEVGEAIFTDPAGLVVARRWGWKQSLESTVTEHTSAAVITVEAQHVGGDEDIARALETLSDLLAEYLSGKISVAGILDRTKVGIVEL